MKSLFCGCITTIPLALACFGIFLASLFNVLNYFVLPRITDEGSVTKMRILSKLFIQSKLKWCMYLFRSLFLYISEVFKWSQGSQNIWRGPAAWAYDGSILEMLIWSIFSIQSEFKMVYPSYQTPLFSLGCS